MIGLSLAYLSDRPFVEAVKIFHDLDDELNLRACELHLEAAQFKAAFWYWDSSARDQVKSIRDRVDSLGIHLPYLDLNPISGNPRLSRTAVASFKAAIINASAWGADYVVFHARGQGGLTTPAGFTLDLWQRVVAILTDISVQHQIDFCFENADDLRSLSAIKDLLTTLPQTQLCFDTGHLFERVELATSWERFGARLCDRYLPWFPLLGKGLPFYDLAADELTNLLDQRLRCVHVHNHNGLRAHKPIFEGKINLRHIFGRLAVNDSVPIILEADYRQSPPEIIKRDIQFLREVCSC